MHIVLYNIQCYAIDLPVDLYSRTRQSHCGFIYKIKLKNTPSCSKQRKDSSMKRREFGLESKHGIISIIVLYHYFAYNTSPSHLYLNFASFKTKTRNKN